MITLRRIAGARCPIPRGNTCGDLAGSLARGVGETRSAAEADEEEETSAAGRRRLP